MLLVLRRMALDGGSMVEQDIIFIFVITPSTPQSRRTIQYLPTHRDQEVDIFARMRME